MKTVLEVLMIAAFYTAVLTRLYQVVIRRMKPGFSDRFTLSALAAGFVIGTVNRILFDPNSHLFLLYLFGVMLTYLTIVLAIPEKKEEAHS